jgi:ketosteroid isomerase-like protein
MSSYRLNLTIDDQFAEILNFLKSEFPLLSDIEIIKMVVGERYSQRNKKVEDFKIHLQTQIIFDLEKTLAKLEAKYKTYDPEEFREIIHPDAIYTFTDGRFDGLDNVLNAFEDTWKVIKNETYKISDVKWLVATENVGVCVYIFEWTGEIDGEIASGKGNATNVLIKDADGNWKFIHEHLSKIVA